MTRKETAVIMQILKTAYPRFYGGTEAPDMADTLRLWAEMFAGDDVALVAAAVKCFIAGDEKGFAPSIGQIKGLMAQLSSPEGLDEEQAWELLRRAASNSAYGAQEEFRRLPESLQRMCSPGQLYEWSQMDSSVFNSVVGSHFRKSYRARQEARRRDALLPPDVKQFLSGLSRPLSLEEGKPSAVTGRESKPSNAP